MTTDQQTGDQASRSGAPLATASNVASVASAVLTLVSVVLDHNVGLRILAASALAVAVVIVTAYWIGNLRRGIPIAPWTAYGMALIAVCSVGFILWTAIAIPHNEDGPGPGPGPTTAGGPTTGSIGVCPSLRTVATIEPERDNSATGPRLSEASYTLTPDDLMLLRWAGRIQGSAAPGQALYLVGTADDQTVDSTPEHNRGTTDYYVKYKLSPDKNGCWSTPVSPAAYECAGGVAFIYNLVSMDATLGRQLEQKQRDDDYTHDNGFPRSTFRRMPVKFLQQFRVDTTAAKCT